MPVGTQSKGRMSITTFQVPPSNPDLPCPCRALHRWPAPLTMAKGALSSDPFRTLATTGHAFDVVEKPTAYQLLAGGCCKGS